MLSELQLAIVDEVLRGRAPGLYTLPQLFGLEWQHQRRPSAYGRWFKASVLHDDVPGVRWVRKRSDRRQEYELLPPSPWTPRPARRVPKGSAAAIKEVGRRVAAAEAASKST